MKTQLCDECECVSHCLKNGCIPKVADPRAVRAGGYERFAAIREGHRNAAEDAWFQAIPNIEPRHAFRAGFDAGYNTRDAAPTGGESGGAVDERDAFEAWFRKEYHDRLCRNMPDKSYNDPTAYSMWFAWQARAALQSVKPQGDAS